MKDRKREKKRILNDDGAALIVVVVITLVLTIMCLSLMLAAGSFKQSASTGIIELQTGEMAKSVSRELEKEITEPSYSVYSDYTTDKAAGKNNLWFYLRDNCAIAKWPYYAEAGNPKGIESAGHGAKEAFRYFDLNANGTDEAPIASDLDICMWYEPAGKDDSEGAADASPDGRKLHVTVSSDRVGGRYSVTTVYVLHLGSTMSGAPDDKTGENWVWSVYERQ